MIQEALLWCVSIKVKRCGLCVSIKVIKCGLSVAIKVKGFWPVYGFNKNKGGVASV